jgi:hypothetical protein
MNRFKMVFNNSGALPPQYNNLGSGLASLSSSRAPVLAAPKNLPLNAPMIDRVHKAKPGCSACGKKVA